MRFDVKRQLIFFLINCLDFEVVGVKRREKGKKVKVLSVDFLKGRGEYFVGFLGLGVQRVIRFLVKSLGKFSLKIGMKWEWIELD